MDLLKKKLLELGLSQSKAARLADIPQSNFNLIVNGKATYICPAWRKRIAKVLKVMENELFQEVDDNAKNENG